MMDGEVRFFLNTLRAALRLEPLPSEGALQPFLFTLDGAKNQSAEAWGRELGISRTTAIFRRARLVDDLAAGRVDAYARALSSNYRMPKPKKRRKVAHAQA